MKITEKPSMSNEAVQAKTEKNWDEWFAILDKAGAAELSHKEIVALLKAYPEVSAWWQQSITVEYEKARGLRVKHQMATGYEISVSKTISAPITVLYNKILDDAQRTNWLEQAETTVRKANENKTIRLNWPGKQIVEIRFADKKAGKTQVTAQHTKLTDAEMVEEMKVYWKEKLESLAEILIF